MFGCQAFNIDWRTTQLSSLLLALMASGGCQFAATGHNQEGVRLFQQGQQHAALQQFQDAIAANPRNPDAYYNLAATIHRVGTQNSNREWQNQAETLYNQCLDLDPNHAECYRGLAVLLAETNRSDKAFALLKNWAVRSPTIADARVELARMYEEFGDKDTAQLQLHQALQVDPNSHRAWSALGRLREQSGDYTQALANYQRAFQLNGSQPQIAERIASLSRSVPGATSPTPPGSTRIVAAPGAPRY